MLLCFQYFLSYDPQIHMKLKMNTDTEHEVGYIIRQISLLQPCSYYTECNRRNGPDFGRVFLRSNYTDITQNTYIQSSMITEILAREV